MSLLSKVGPRNLTRKTTYSLFQVPGAVFFSKDHYPTVRGSVGHDLVLEMITGSRGPLPQNCECPSTTENVRLLRVPGGRILLQRFTYTLSDIG